MSGSDMEKGAGVHSPQQPRAAVVFPRDSFLPTYEEHLNTELRNFPDAAPQARPQPFDRIEEPATKRKALLRRRSWWSAISTVLFLVISAVIGSAVFLYRSTHLKDSGTKHVSETSMPMPAREAATVTFFPTTVTITVPKTTVYVTAPVPATSTSTRIVTVQPSSTTTTEADLLPTTGEPSLITFSTEATSVASFSTSSTSTSSTSASSTSTSSTSTSSTSTSNTSASSSSETTPPPPPPPPPPSTESTTLVSVTTATATPTTSSIPPPPTRSGREPGFCGVVGEACA
ncbi:uncharacterized protein RCC_10396 [Ramularia collo-cygni]|uniref:Uncharacterized protein n=1 Tax=Ramularia collo-cygni TaxID=112498 RepID=A0A2D3VCD9_9PEZI|nr:uncharacterized protein RCC_10396 [Ramularia collo-cygni]CZT24670.1 uncharacterized protein RCC_10396 [Ramularia collo-cygni]